MSSNGHRHRRDCVFVKWAFHLHFELLQAAHSVRKNLNNLTFLSGDIKRYYERGGLKSKRLRNESISEIVCTESVRSGGTSAAKSLKIPGTTTCASSFGSALLNALELPSLYAFSRQLAQNETGVQSPAFRKMANGL